MKSSIIVLLTIAVDRGCVLPAAAEELDANLAATYVVDDPLTIKEKAMLLFCKFEMSQASDRLITQGLVSKQEFLESCIEAFCATIWDDSDTFCIEKNVPLLRGLAESLRAENEDRRGENEDLRDENEKLRDENEKLCDENENLRERLAELPFPNFTHTSHAFFAGLFFAAVILDLYHLLRIVLRIVWPRGEAPPLAPSHGLAQLHHRA